MTRFWPRTKQQDADAPLTCAMHGLAMLGGLWEINKTKVGKVYEMKKQKRMKRKQGEKGGNMRFHQRADLLFSHTH